jgi:hypothetical protein
VKKLHVVALSYRAVSLGATWHRGEGTLGCIVVGGESAVTYANPIGVPNAAWDVKTVLGDAEVYEDGSAAFYVPARTPVYFQAIDAEGHVVQTMRSWSTLQPGETFSCVGCHESKLEAPPPLPLSIAMQNGPQTLSPFYDASGRGFSFPGIIQPILDNKCVECHNSANPNGINLENTPVWKDDARKNFSLSYLNLLQNDWRPMYGYYDNGEAIWHEQERQGKLVQWPGAESTPSLLPPYPPGSRSSPLIEILKQGHEGVQLSSEEMEKLCCWIDLYVPFSGDYTEGMNDGDKGTYAYWMNKRMEWKEQESQNIAAFVRDFPVSADYRLSGPKRNPHEHYMIRTVSGSLRVPHTNTYNRVNVYNARGILIRVLDPNRNRTAGRIEVAPGTYIIIPSKE